jgi:hypothetical protein
LAELNPLLNESDANPGNSRAFEGPRESLRTVAVPIRFENGPHRHLTYRTPYDVEIVAKVSKVDLRPRRTNGIGR